MRYNGIITFRIINIRPIIILPCSPLIDGTIEARRARVLITARSKATAMLFRLRTSYHEHTGASAFDRPIDGKHDNIIMGLILMIRTVCDAIAPPPNGGIVTHIARWWMS